MSEGENDVEALETISDIDDAFTKAWKVSQTPRVSAQEDMLAEALARFGLRFERQVKIPLGELAERVGMPPHYLVDFLVEKKLVVEVDSGWSGGKKKMRKWGVTRTKWNRRRDATLKRLGYQVMHVKTQHVELYPDVCAWNILNSVTVWGIETHAQPQLALPFTSIRPVDRHRVLVGISIDCSLDGFKNFLAQRFGEEVRQHLASSDRALIERTHIKHPGGEIAVEAGRKETLNVIEGKYCEIRLIKAENVKSINYDYSKLGSRLIWTPSQCNPSLGKLTGEVTPDMLEMFRKARIIKKWAGESRLQRVQEAIDRCEELCERPKAVSEIR